MNDEQNLKTMKAMESKKRNRLEDLVNQYGSTTGRRVFEQEKNLIEKENI
jgi:hypothetical protein